MGKCIESAELSETLTLSKCSDGYWLWDQTRQMNLSVKAKDSTAAFVEALRYYQERLLKVEAELRDYSTKVDAFIAQFVEPEEEAE